jgi:hypothetical protein
MSKYDVSHSMPDGCMIRTAPDGSWDLTLPSGKHLRGKASNQDTAYTEALEAHKRFAYSMWLRGSPIAGGHMKVPLR